MESEISERPADDTTETPDGSRAGRGRATGGYYYDDGTGYEIYRPEEDKDEDDSGESAAEDEGRK
ncbi:MAG: hypothetical protein LC754_11205 [Acidobacteria bacterium]|nr:hypothetical protein [Acidobacteriota bacterium]